MKFYGEVESSVVEPPFSGRDGDGEVDPKFFTPVSGGLAPVLDKFTPPAVSRCSANPGSGHISLKTDNPVLYAFIKA